MTTKQLEVTARTEGGLRTEATDGENTVVLDEPKDVGGTGEGLSPQRMVLASLAGCTAMTLKMYSQRKEWPLEDVSIRVTWQPPEKGMGGRIKQHVTLVGDLDEEQRGRLLQIAGRCPVHRMLEGGNDFEEVLEDAVSPGAERDADD